MGEERSGRTHVVPLLVIGAIASALGIALGLTINWFPTVASSQAKKIDTLWDVLLIVSVPIFVLVVTVVLYSVWRFRMRPGQEHLDGPPLHGNTRLEIVWTAVPAMLLVMLCTYAYFVLDDVEDAKAQAPMDVRVVGQQFAWTFFYKNPGGGKEIASPRLYLPANTEILFHVQTKDVLHDFWVPAFRLKIDAVPGITTNFNATTTGKAGTYPVVCAELCGLGHAVMRQTATVMPAARYQAWLRKQAQGGGGAAGANGGTTAAIGGAAGKQIFTSDATRCST